MSPHGEASCVLPAHEMNQAEGEVTTWREASGTMGKIGTKLAGSRVMWRRSLIGGVVRRNVGRTL
jgi:hypothetical protein